MQYLLENNVTARWYMFVDDDTWINVPMLRRFLPRLEERADDIPYSNDPHNQGVICGFREFKSGMYNGGAGILLDQVGFRRVAAALYEIPCTFQDANDNTLTHCAEALGGFAFVHSDLFMFYPPPPREVWDFVEKVSVHPVTSEALMNDMTTAARDLMACQ